MVRVFSTQVDVVKQTISSLSVDEVIASSESIEYVSQPNATSLASGNNEVVSFSPPSGYLYEVLMLYFQVLADAHATSGTHSILVSCAGAALPIMEGESNYNTDLKLKNSIILSADVNKVPSTEVAQISAYKGIRLDSSQALNMKYYNFADVAQENTRLYRLLVRKIKVA